MRLIDANALMKAFRDYMAKHHDRERCISQENCNACKVGCLWHRIVKEAPTIDPESLRSQGEWVWKHRHHGGFHRYTGVDDFGNTHTITVDERFECDEPYCLNCGKWNESVFLNYCPNCGAKMKGAGENE